LQQRRLAALERANQFDQIAGNAAGDRKHPHRGVALGTRLEHPPHCPLRLRAASPKRPRRRHRKQKRIDPAAQRSTASRPSDVDVVGKTMASRVLDRLHPEIAEGQEVIDRQQVKRPFPNELACNAGASPGDIPRPGGFSAHSVYKETGQNRDCVDANLPCHVSSPIR